MGDEPQVRTVLRQSGLNLAWARLCAFCGLAGLLALLSFARAGEADRIQSVTIVGTFQTDLGCPYNWDPSCTQSYLLDTGGDGIYRLSTRELPRGTYECRVVINEDWRESYGAEGDRDGANVIFEVSEAGSLVTFAYDSPSHVLSAREDATTVVAESVSCQSNQDCTEQLGSDWECKSGLCVQTGGNNTTFFCGFSAFLGNDHPALDVFRRFRDEVLKKHALGRRLIDLYYKNQRAVFAFIEKHPRLKQGTVKLMESSALVLEFFLDDSSRASSRPRH
jgi:hypothetical protein